VPEVELAELLALELLEAPLLELLELLELPALLEADVLAVVVDPPPLLVLEVLVPAPLVVPPVLLSTAEPAHAPASTATDASAASAHARRIVRPLMARAPRRGSNWSSCCLRRRVPHGAWASRRVQHGSPQSACYAATVSRTLALVTLVACVAACGRTEEGSGRGAVTPPVAVTTEAPPVTAPAATTSTSTAAAAVTPRRIAEIEVRTITFEPGEGGPQQAVIVGPRDAVGEQLPLVVALGGLGETRKGIAAGAGAWVNDYWLDRAMKRLAAPPLTVADFQDLIDPARLAAINASLAARPFRGLFVACPFTPDLITPKRLDNAGPFARFVVSKLLPRVRAEAPVAVTRSATGIDGVSLGGRIALLVALSERDTFGAVGAMQAAFDVAEVPAVGERTAALLARGGTRLRLVTSDTDFYREAVLGLHAALEASHASHDYLYMVAPHGYRFNRGPGAIEMLLWHDRVLRGEAPEP
jgi:hypothetical protein